MNFDLQTNQYLEKFLFEKADDSGYFEDLKWSIIHFVRKQHPEYTINFMTELFNSKDILQLREVFKKYYTSLSDTMEELLDKEEA